MADFAGGRITSDAGGLLLREVDQRYRLAENIPLLAFDGRPGFPLAAVLLAKAHRHCQETGEKPRLFTAFSCQADSWDRPQRLSAKGEYGPLGANQRFGVTNLVRPPVRL